ncbi:MAG: SDR family oxidoreductase [Planctomycetes bacterium]|nr:SDR family oxidoreductase [Planctomycetota bacterium]
MKNKRVAITGGAGFIGSNLAHELSNDNAVIIVDDLSTGRQENIADLIDQQNVTFFHGSILDTELLGRAFSGVDFILHQAAIPSVPRSVANPQASHHANITGTLNVLIAARESGVKKVVCASSSSVYGDTPTLPKQEDMMPNPQSPYAVTKLSGEHYCHVFQRVYSLPTACLRYFNVFGPGQDPNSQYAAVVPNFITRVSQGQSPVIFGDGEQTRDFTFIRDVVQANILAAESDASGVFNIGGGGNRISVNELARLIANIMAKNIEPIHRESRAGDVKHSLADISRAKSFGWEPKWSLEEGLKETIRSFQNET